MDCEEPHTNFRVASEAGTRLPLHCTSQGKIILANRPASEVGALLRRKELYAYTDATVTDAQALLQELPALKRAGYAEERQEYRLGLQSVAAPIFDNRGDCSYAIGVICMATVSEERFVQMRTAVAAAAYAVSAELGWQSRGR